ncbi:MAG: hypothetical protein NTV34_15845 [Proteobacteria bacterium]|nr:hypothetical protein [Pseudomonadota bacterium]
MKKTVLAIAFGAFIHGNAKAESSVKTDFNRSGRFVGTGVGGSYLEAIEDMFNRAIDVCGETNQFPHLDSHIFTFPVGTFVPVRGYFLCAESPKGISPKAMSN